MHRHKLQLVYPRLQRSPSDLNFWSMAPINLRNELCTCLVFGIVFVYFDVIARHRQAWPLLWLADRLPAFATTLIWVGLLSVCYDIVFFVGHWAMHVHPALYRSWHKLHHRSQADQGVSHHYMQAVDFVLETVLPSCLPALLLGQHGAGWIAFVGTLLITQSPFIQPHHFPTSAQCISSQIVN